MRAISTAKFPEDRHLLCEQGEVLTIFAPYDANGFKLFNRNGLVLLNNTVENKNGAGVSLDDPFEQQNPLPNPEL